MRKNNSDFFLPQRESPWAILFILGKSLYSLFTRIWPALLVVFFNVDSKRGYPNYLLVTVLILTVLAMITSVVNYFKTYFFIKENELIITKGVFHKTKINIPFERIQSIQVQQNLIHSICKVVQLKIDTAGSEKAEVGFHAIETWKANSLKAFILSGKQRVDKNVSNEEMKEFSNRTVFMRLGIIDLVKVGLSRNHLKSGWIIVLFFLWLYDNLNEIGVDTESYYQNWFNPSSSLAWFFYVGVLFFLVSVIISLVRSILTFFDLHLERVEGGFKLFSGLFTRKEIAVKDQKIQVISWSDNWLKRALHYFDLKMIQASDGGMSNQQKVSVPGVVLPMINNVVAQIFHFEIPDKAKAKRIHASYFWRYFLIMSLLFLPVFSFLWLYEFTLYAVLITFGFLLLICIRLLKFQRLRYFLNDNLCLVWGGAFGEKNDIFPVYKLQGISWNQSPFQRKKGLVTLHFYLASGSIILPYVPWQEAQEIINLSLYVSESTNKKWM